MRTEQVRFSPAEIAAIREQLATSENWYPNPGRQEEFVSSEEKDVAYGGARGGGKSIGLVMSYGRYEAKYGKHAHGVLARKTFPELEDLMRKAHAYLVGQLGFTFRGGAAPTFTSPRGATLRMTHLRNMDDARQHDGHEYPWQGFDEIGNWADPAPVDYLLGCMRSPHGIPTMRRSSCMPGGPGHVWVKERYDPEHPGVVRDLIPLAEKPHLKLRSLFIRALLEDNPKLNPDEYEIALAGQGDVKLYEAWRYGNWDVIAGAFFECWDEDTMTVEPSEVKIEPWHIRWAACDWGFKDDCVVGWYAQDEQRNIVRYRELKVNKTTPDALGRKVVALSVDDNGEREDLKHFFLSPDAFAERDSPRTIASEISKELRAGGLPAAARADNDREGGWMLLYQMLLTGKLKLSKVGVELIRALPLLQRDEKNSADIAEHPYDHAPDECRYALKTYIRESRVPREVIVQQYVAERLARGGAAMTFQESVRPGQPRIEAPVDYTRIAMLAERGEAKQRHVYRPRAKGYGRKFHAR